MRHLENIQKNDGGREMKCRETQFGDWCCNKHGFSMQITNVGGDYAYATWEGNEGDPWEFDDKDDQPQPIVLTPEILEKNGFKYKTTDWDVVYEGPHYGKYNLKKFHVLIGKENITLASYYGYIGHGDVDAHGFAQINYVHELQRALRCCGLWDIAENFKI